MEELLLKTNSIMKKNASVPNFGLDSSCAENTFEVVSLGQESDTKPALTKAELADFLFDQLGLNKREAKDFVDGFFDEIRQTLEVGT